MEKKETRYCIKHTIVIDSKFINSFIIERVNELLNSIKALKGISITSTNYKLQLTNDSNISISKKFECLEITTNLKNNSKNLNKKGISNEYSKSI